MPRLEEISQIVECMEQDSPGWYIDVTVFPDGSARWRAIPGCILEASTPEDLRAAIARASR